MASKKPVMRRSVSIGSFWSLAWPVMLSTGLVTGFGLLDMGFIARLGTDAVAAVSASSTVMRITTGFGEGIKAAVLALTARFVGRDELQRVRTISLHGIVLSVGCGVVVFLVVFVFRFPLIRFFGRSEEFVTGGAIYLQYIGLGSIFLFGYLAIGAVFQGCGNTRIPLLFIASANAVNVVLDPLLIYGVGPFPELGIAGAGIATFIGNCVGFLLAMILLVVGTGPVPKLSMKGVKLDSGLIKDIIRISAPAGGQMSTRPVSGMILLRMVAVFGTAPVAAFGIGLRLTSFCAVFSTGLSAAVATLTGQSLGRNDVNAVRRVIRVGMGIGFAIFIVLGLIFLIIPRFLFLPFDPAADVLSHGAAYLRILSIAIVFLAAMAVLQGVFRGAGDTDALMQTSILANFPVKLGAASLLAFVWPAVTSGIWIGISFSIFAEIGLLFLWFRNGRWYKRRTISWKP